MDNQEQPQGAAEGAPVTPEGAAVAPEPQPTVVEPVATPSPLEAFKDGYQKLCEQTGMTLSLEPKWVKQDNGSYGLVVATDIIPKV